MLKKIVLIFGALALFLVGCSTKKEVTKPTASKTNGTIEYSQLSNKEQNKFKFDLTGKFDKDKKQVIIDGEINNKSKSEVRFNYADLTINQIEMPSIQKDDVVIKAGKTVKIPRLFVISNLDIFKKNVKVFYENKVLKNLVFNFKNRPELDEYLAKKLAVSTQSTTSSKATTNNRTSSTTSTRSSKSSAEISKSNPQGTNENTAKKPAVDLNNLKDANWISGTPAKLQGNYLSDPTGQSTSMETNYKIKLVLTGSEYKLIPEAQIDSFYLGKLQHVQVNDSTFILYGTSIGDTKFYEKVTVQPNGDLAINQGSENPNEFDSRALVFHRQ